MNARSKRLYAEWEGGQGAKIKAARPLAVYGSCASMARQLADTLPPEYTRLLLTTEQIEECDMRAVTSARSVRFGVPPADAEVWKQQIAQLREEWANPQLQEKAA